MVFSIMVGLPFLEREKVTVLLYEFLRCCTGEVRFESVPVKASRKRKTQMAEKSADKVTCPRCSSQNVQLVSRKNNLRPRSQTGNFKTDLTPISTTVTYKCQDKCG